MRTFAAPSLRLALLVLVAGCSSTTGGAGPVVDASSAPIGFQPSNVSLADVEAAQPMAQSETIPTSCKVETDPSSPDTDCFQSPIKAVTQPDGSTVNLVVVTSLTLASGATMTVEGPVPFVLVSLGDVTLSGTVDAHSSLLDVGAGGSPESASNVKGAGPGGGAAASGTTAVGASGGTYCGVGGQGGGQTATASSVGSIDLRPLVGGSSGGGGSVGSGAGGGGVQFVAGGALTVSSGAGITVGGGGGPISGLAAGQNAGGGGSGGSILLEGTTVTIGGTLAANGGGGGGDYASAPGADATANATPAPGGAGGSSGAAGGAGGAGSSLAGSAGKAAMGLNSGAGGGGVGRIRLNSMSGMASVTGMVSPPQTTLCAIVATVRSFSEGP